MGLGVYSDRQIRSFVNQGIIESEGIRKGQTQPSSLDFSLGPEVNCMRCSAIPHSGITEHIKENLLYQFTIDGKGGLLHNGQVYLAELSESLNLERYLAGLSNPKSSIGRIDTHVRMISEKGIHFDRVPVGYNGKLFLEIYSPNFQLNVKQGERLNQVRFYDYQTRPLDASQIKNLEEVSEEGLMLDRGGKRISLEEHIEDDSLVLTLNLNQSPSAFVSRKNTPPVDFSKRDLPFSEYFHPVLAKDGRIIIEHGDFYLLSTNELVNIPNDYCAEMVDVKTSSGEYRAHYAGFFDPGFSGEAVLELRNTGPPFQLVHGQNIANLRFFPMKETPKKSYGKDSNYQGQRGIRAAKFFDMNK